MRKILVYVLILFALTAAAATAVAGPGNSHSHGPVTPISESQAQEKATGVVKKLVEKGKIDSSWADIAPKNGEKKRGKFGPEWVVTFDNPKIDDEAKQTLYVFLNLGGEYIAANYTGN